MEWDEGNEAELAVHRISPAEVEETWTNREIWVPNRRRRPGDWKLRGRTSGGRALTIVIRYYPDRRTVRPITGWDATASELKLFR